MTGFAGDNCAGKINKIPTYDKVNQIEPSEILCGEIQLTLIYDFLHTTVSRCFGKYSFQVAAFGETLQISLAFLSFFKKSSGMQKLDI